MTVVVSLFLFGRTVNARLLSFMRMHVLICNVKMSNWFRRQMFVTVHRRKFFIVIHLIFFMPKSTARMLNTGTYEQRKSCTNMCTLLILQELNAENSELQ